MARRNADSQAEHDRVVEAWAQAVVRRFSKDVQVSTNPGDRKRAQVGRPDDPRFLDVLIWRSDRADGRDGTAELVAEVETSETPFRKTRWRNGPPMASFQRPFPWLFRQVLSRKPSGCSRRRRSAFHSCGRTLS
jgi:hypothetical protein